jgi:hypothetical protein
MTDTKELIGCACRWDADDKRVATCVRHQGWLDVVQEWADRAKTAESKIPALASESISNAQMVIKLQALLDGNMALNERLQAQQAQPADPFTTRELVLMNEGHVHSKQFGLAQQVQPEQVNAMLLEALEAAEKLEHAALVALSEATYELKVGNTYTTATDTYKANNDLIHRLDKILNLQYRDRKREVRLAAQQAQPELTLVNSWLIFDKDGEQLFIQQDAASVKRYQDAGYVVKRLGYFASVQQAQPDPAHALQAEVERLKAALNQQVALVEKCMVAMNENADRGQAAEDERDALQAQQGGQQ